LSYPVTHLALTAEDAVALRRLAAPPGDDAAVLGRARELAAAAASRLVIDAEWRPIEPRRG